MQNLTTEIAAWAAEKPLVKRVWIFGSRARGDHRPDSDLDVAVELDMSAIQGADDSGGSATWIFEAGSWGPELEAVLGLPVDLEQYQHGVTTVIQTGLDRSSVLVYEKSAG
ncbi:nucleotidyltransferase family protein [Kinneretia aquatilis]|uniref:nucleotidyltransferase family protein n=1 Tax=Kinneretia aquatilis TaxID=2070761 RepID=UPI0014954125|nr:nucleotidyltransferase domain-containing protein [Paucibacter aquatile]WIV99657.1 nucleotidyltransferase domain-containing protein [Paucibacter aquatile]